jgi:MoxR-like ATPase
LRSAKSSIETVIFGQEQVIDLALIAILSGGHALLVGACPVSAKTKLVHHAGHGAGP